MIPSVFRTLKFQVALALGIQFLLLAGVIGTTIYQLDLRKHDYVILNLAGQLRVISQVMVNQSQAYIGQAPRSNRANYRDHSLYRSNLDSLVADYQEIIASFKQRKLSPKLTGRDAPLVCTWDRQSLNQLDLTAIVWEDFRHGLEQALGPNRLEPRLETGAGYISRQKDKLMKASTDLANSFQAMMEGKLSSIRMLNQFAILLSVLIAGTLGLLLHYKAFRPLDRTVKGFKRVSQGDLAYQIPVSADNEVGYMTGMFNRLTQRLAALFHLTDRINQGTNLDETLRFVYEEFRGFLPIDWTGLLRMSPEKDHFLLERVYTSLADSPPEGDRFEAADPLLQGVFETREPRVAHLARADQTDSRQLRHRLARAGIGSIIVLPLASSGIQDAVLLFATCEKNVYQDEHLELLKNIGGQLGRSFDKTYGMEGLVISAVEGLAKLAESRDPETGDHLYRMSMYSAILAQQLGRKGPYVDLISPAYIRDVFRFAPMHDIGKVGIEDHILLKPGALDETERRRMEEHPIIGAQVLRRCEDQVNAVGYSIFQVGIEIAEGHHERFDGAGYPHGRGGDEIPLSARIVAVADVFDALTSKRPYKEAWPIEKTLAVMSAESGKHFDPVIIEALDDAMPRILEVYEQNKHI
ncbi:MAG: HD domain-containing protein [Acidiferrobacterales bacterium]|nr:HD domain-containing protein [Acidiferrobacterales bacterium]